MSSSNGNGDITQASLGSRKEGLDSTESLESFEHARVRDARITMGELEYKIIERIDDYKKNGVPEKYLFAVVGENGDVVCVCDTFRIVTRLNSGEELFKFKVGFFKNVVVKDGVIHKSDVWSNFDSLGFSIKKVGWLNYELSFDPSKLDRDSAIGMAAVIYTAAKWSPG